MSEAKHPTIETLFDSLDRWRHFAGYPLEARVDALIGLFLPRVIEDCCGIKVGKHIIPQFPLKISEDNNRCNWVDYFALSRDSKHAFLIELKTDMSSQSKEQYKYIEKAKNKGMYRIICDLKEVAKAKNDKRARKKYFHILHALAEIGLIELPPDLEGIMYANKSEKVFCCIGRIELCKVPPKLKVVCIQPRKYDSIASSYSNFQFIDFDELACSIQDHGKLGELLACYLRQWKSDPGQCPPSKAQDNRVKGVKPA